MKRMLLVLLFLLGPISRAQSNVLTGRKQDLGIVTTHMGIQAGGLEKAYEQSWLKILFIAGWLPQDAMAKQDNERAIELADKLLASR